jgi:alpha-ribazole phosphatase
VRLFLIRHPRPKIEPGVCYGRSDIDLDGEPDAAASMGDRLRPNLPATAPVYSSPLRRCRQLAQQLHAAPVFDDRLMEMHFGEWELKPWAAISREKMDEWAADSLDFVPPGGESAAQLQARAVGFCTALQLADVTEAVLVTHAGIIKALCGHYERLAAEEWMRLDFKFGSITLIENNQRVWQNVGHD